MALVVTERDLRRAITLTAPSTAKTDGRPVLEGVHVTVEDGRAVFISSDGFQLSEVKVDLDPHSHDNDDKIADFDYVFSGKELRSLRTKCGKNSNDRVIISPEGFQINGTKYEVPLINGNYPQTEIFTDIADDDDRVEVAKVSAADIVAVAQAAVAMKVVALRIATNANRVDFYSWTDNDIEFTASIGNDSMFLPSDERHWIAVSPKYLGGLATAILQIDRDATIEFRWSESCIGTSFRGGAPIILKGDLVTDHLLLLMPMYVEENDVRKMPGLQDFWRRRIADLDEADRALKAMEAKIEGSE